MTEEEWPVCENAREMIDKYRAAISERKMRLLACSFCRLAWKRIGDERFRRVVEVAEDAADSSTPEAILEPVQAGAFELDEELTRNCSHVSSMPGMAAVILAHGGSYDALGFIPTSPGASHRPRVVRCIFGNPFHPVTFFPEWRTSTVLALAQQMYESRDFSAMPILADALGDAGCEDEAVLTHCRGPGPHVRGCWCVDAILGRS